MNIRRRVYRNLIPAHLLTRFGIDPAGPAVGLMEGLTFEIGSAEFAPGDLLMIYTDGVVDARDEKNESFGEDRLIEAIASAAGPENASPQIMSRLAAHITSQDQFDDITMMGLYRNG